MDWRKEIKNKIKGDVAIDEETLASHSRDASIFDIKPAVVIFPQDAEDVREVVKFTLEKKLQGMPFSLTARAAGTDMTGGPLTESIVLDFNKFFNRFIELGSDYAIVEPGMFYRDFEKETLKGNLLMPSFPASRELCAVGGMVANNSGGEKTLAYGKTNDYVRQLKVILADGNEYVMKPLNRLELQEKLNLQNFEGEIYRKLFQLVDGNKDLIRSAKPAVSKNSAGYDLWDVWDGETFDITQLIVGSQGTLGLITQITFGLIKPKSHSNLLVIFLNDLKSLSAIVNTTLGFKPETFESYDHHTLRLAMKFFPDLVRKLKTNILKLGWQFLPEVGMVLRHGLPKLVLLAEFSGNSDEEAIAKAKEAQAMLARYNIATRVTKSDLEANKYRTIRRESFNLLRHKIQDKQTIPAFEDIIVRPEYLPEFLPQLESLLDEYNFVYTIAGHVGDGNFHIIPLMDLSDPESHRIIPEVTERVLDLVWQYHGSMSAEHNDGLIRSPYEEKMFGKEVYKLFVQAKAIFDPNNIFNPGKKVNASLNYALEHIKHGA